MIDAHHQSRRNFGRAAHRPTSSLASSSNSSSTAAGAGAEYVGFADSAESSLHHELNDAAIAAAHAAEKCAAAVRHHDYHAETAAMADCLGTNELRQKHQRRCSTLVTASVSDLTRQLEAQFARANQLEAQLSTRTAASSASG